MKKIFQIVFYSAVLAIFTPACTTVDYNEEDETLGFGPVKCEYCEGPCTCSNRFEIDDDLTIHKELEKK